MNGLPKSSMNRLQVVRNSLARAIYLLAKRSDHVWPLLHKLHWLPVSSRFEFKIATLTFKVLKFQQPAYMFDLIAPYIPPQSLRSSNKNLLIVPDIWSEMGHRSFFLLNLPFETLSFNIFVPRIHYRGPEIQFLHNLFYVSNWHMARYQLCIIVIIIIIIYFYEFAQDFLISKVAFAIVTNSLHIVSSYFDLRTYNGHASLPCISHSLHFSK